MTNDSTTPNARGIIETTLANGHRIGDLTREDALHILSALRAAANASDGDTITIAADGTLGRLEVADAEQYVKHADENRVQFGWRRTYRVVTP